MLVLLLLGLPATSAQEYTLTASNWSSCSQTSCNEMGSQTRTLTCLNAWNVQVDISNCQDCDDMDWADSLGYTCQVYEQDELCTSEGAEGSGWNSNWGSIADFANDGKDAFTACCACGGGKLLSAGATQRGCVDTSICTSTTTTTTTTSTTQTAVESYSWSISDWSSCEQDVCTKLGSQTRNVSCLSSLNGSAVSSSLCEVCEDSYSTWRDIDGYSCDTYVENSWCTSSGGYGSGWSSDWGEFSDFTYQSYGTATQSCCECGGGAVEDVSTIPVTRSCTDFSKCTTFTTTTSTTTTTTTTTLEFLWQTTDWTDCYQPSCGAVGRQNRTLYCVAYDGADMNSAVTVDDSYCENQASCTEYPANFRDKDGDSCSTYVKNKWCADDGYGSNWDSAWGTFAAFTNKQGYNAGDSCCTCGGGTRLGVEKPNELNRICYDSSRCSSTTTTTQSTTTTTTTTTSSTTLSTTYTGSTSTLTSTTKTSTTTSSRLISFVVSDWSSCRQLDCGTLGTQERSVACSDQMGISYSLDRCQETCVDLEEWMDTEGRTCEDYRLNALCTADGEMGTGWGENIITSFEVYRNDGYIAPEVCCACGGGRKPFIPVSSKSCVVDSCRPTFVLGDWRVCDQQNCSVNGTQSQNLLCEDVAGESVAVSECEAYATCTTTYMDWVDTDGYSCEDYQDYGWCTIYGEVGSYWTLRSNSSIESFGTEGVSAFDACCECGGGQHDQPEVATQNCTVSQCTVDTSGEVVGLSILSTTVTISSQTVTDYSFALIRSLASLLETSADQISISDVAAASISETANAYDVNWLVLQDGLATNKQALTFLATDSSNLQSTLLTYAKAIGQTTKSLTVEALSTPTVSNMSVSWRSSNWTDCEADTSSYGVTGCITQYLTGAYTRSVECIDDATQVAIDTDYCEFAISTPASSEACEVEASKIPSCSRIDSTESTEVVSLKGSMGLRLVRSRRLTEADVDSEAFQLAVQTSIATSLGLDTSKVSLTEYTVDDDSVDVTFTIIYLASDSDAASNASSAWSQFNGSDWVDAYLTPVLEDANLTTTATISAELAAPTLSDAVTTSAIFSGWAACDCTGVTTRSMWCVDASSGEEVDSDLCSFDTTAITETTCIMPDDCTTSTTRTTTASTTLAKKTTAPAIVRVTEGDESNAANAVIAVIAACVGLVMITCCGCVLRTLHRSGNVPLMRKKTGENASLSAGAASPPSGGVGGLGQPQQARIDTLGSEDVQVAMEEGVGRNQPRTLATRTAARTDCLNVEDEASPQPQSEGSSPADMLSDGQVAQPRQTSHVSEWATTSRGQADTEDWAQVAALMRNQTNDSRMVEVQGRPNLNL